MAEQATVTVEAENGQLGTFREDEMKYIQAFLDENKGEKPQIPDAEQEKILDEAFAALGV